MQWCLKTDGVPTSGRHEERSPTPPPLFGESGSAGNMVQHKDTGGGGGVERCDYLYGLVRYLPRPPVVIVSTAAVSPFSSYTSTTGGIEAFNAMAANIANNTTASLSNKRAKPNHQPSTSDGRGYTVAIGKGLKHQFNGYLRTSGNSNTTSTNSTYTKKANSTSSSSTTAPSYLSHLSAQLASAAPAPLQFLDPSELGMSIESSFRQLKDAFAASANNNIGSGTASTAATSAKAVSTNASSVSLSTLSSNNSSNSGAGTYKHHYPTSAISSMHHRH